MIADCTPRSSLMHDIPKQPRRLMGWRFAYALSDDIPKQPSRLMSWCCANALSDDIAKQSCRLVGVSLGELLSNHGPKQPCSFITGRLVVRLGRRRRSRAGPSRMKSEVYARLFQTLTMCQKDERQSSDSFVLHDWKNSVSRRCADQRRWYVRGDKSLGCLSGSLAKPRLVGRMSWDKKGGRHTRVSIYEQ